MKGYEGQIIAKYIRLALNNVEVWYDLTKAEIDEFEQLDLNLFRKILRVPVTTPKIALYLELGLVPISILIMGRQVRYLHYLVSKKKDDMLGIFSGLSGEVQ